MKVEYIESPKYCPYQSCNNQCAHWFFTKRDTEYTLHPCSREMDEFPSDCPLKDIPNHHSKCCDDSCDEGE